MECKSRLIGYKVQCKSCHGNNWKVPNLKTKWLTPGLLIDSDQIVVKQFKENEKKKNRNTTKATQTCLNILEKWATERKDNPKLVSTKTSIKCSNVLHKIFSTI